MFIDSSAKELLLLVGWTVPVLFQFLITVGGCAQILKPLVWGSRRKPEKEFPISVVVPVRGRTLTLERCIRSLCQLATNHADNVEVYVCIADENDLALPLIETLIKGSAVQLHIGRHLESSNEKLNTVAVGYMAATHDHILFTDDNVLWTSDLLAETRYWFGRSVGLVSSVAVATAPSNFVGRLEQAFANGYLGRLLLASDSVGLSFAQGKLMLFRRSILDAHGGIESLTSGLCEDSALRDRLRDAGYRSTLMTESVNHPVTGRRWAEFWQRHVRWFRCRQAHAPGMFWLEPWMGLVSSCLFGFFWASFKVSVGWWPPIVLSMFFWVLFEFVFLRVRRVRFDAGYLPALLVRELLLPIVWTWSAGARSVRWRDHLFEFRRR